MREYNLFISHSWSYGDAYVRLCNLLNEANYFSYNNFSIPENDPLRINAKSNSAYQRLLREKLKEQMKHASVVLILAGVYASYSDSIEMEIEIANELEKPIIAVEPWGSEKTSSIVKANADAIVSWNTSSIVEAIKAHSI